MMIVELSVHNYKLKQIIHVGNLSLDLSLGALLTGLTIENVNMTFINDDLDRLLGNLTDTHLS